jgi:hypothetical protein
MSKHLITQNKTYGHQSLVNLVNQKGHEKPIKEAYERYVAEVSKALFNQDVEINCFAVQLDLPDVNYRYFDFHGECGHMRWDRISVLIDQMKESLENDGSGSFRVSIQFLTEILCSYFRIDSDALKPTRLQSGIARSNCMDNLDRTNVVQASFAKYTLTSQLRELGIISPTEDIDDFESLSKDFRESQLFSFLSLSYGL